MATSSIFHNVILRTQKEIEDFCNAIDECEKDPYVYDGPPMHRIIDPDNPRGYIYIFDDERTD